MQLVTVGKKKFLRCSCGFRIRIGVPCICIYRIVNEMYLGMIELRYWKIFNAYYAMESAYKDILYTAQGESFLYEKFGESLFSIHFSCFENIIKIQYIFQSC